MESLQLAAQSLYIQRIRQTLQGGTAVIQFLLIRVKFNIHSHTLSFRQITESQYTKKFRNCKYFLPLVKIVCQVNLFTGAFAKVKKPVCGD